MKSIIFVCLGNICRSSLAEGIAKSRAKALGLKIKIHSAGLSHYHNGEAPCDLSIHMAKAHGIDISKQRSQHTSEFKLKSYDLVIALDESNKNELLKMKLKNVKKLGDFGFNGQDVADLYYTPEKSEEVWELISCAVEDILKL
ncbi:MAG: Low molecular weight protein tyrosine phosphatase (EC [uncultured Sulfurovum sp.]|uniref:protein-tyrosine-phosphatase n=1 Tax=uncultured Sulfurovum sp. TaxID=269237 RepID=A0A6S6TA38_9BACT|nr:MAG: Low molecular weight protein tyrosine phosphatase (EC [uncultured Sulfurovum sp.]